MPRFFVIPIRYDGLHRIPMIPEPIEIEASDPHMAVAAVQDALPQMTVVVPHEFDVRQVDDHDRAVGKVRRYSRTCNELPDLNDS